jgi:hypothetical protein
VSDDAPGPLRQLDVTDPRVPQRWLGPRRRPVPGAGWLLASRIVLALVGAISLMILALAIGMRLGDHQIDDHRGTATATVLSVSPLRTGIEFVDGAGVTIRPPDGVLYPGLLSVGQQFMVEYSTSDPLVVRVGGRTAAVGNVSLAIALLTTWIVGAAAVWLLRSKFRVRSGAVGPEATEALT